MYDDFKIIGACNSVFETLKTWRQNPSDHDELKGSFLGYDKWLGIIITENFM